MSSLPNKLFSGLAAAAGISAFAMPLIAPWFLLSLVAAGVSLSFVTVGRQRKIAFGFVFFAVLLVFEGHISAPLAVACISAATLAATGRLALGVCVLALNLTIVASAQGLIGELLHQRNLEAVGPALLAAFFLALGSGNTTRVIAIAGSALLSIILTRIAIGVSSSPEIILATSAMPVTIMATLIGVAEPASRRWIALFVPVFFAAIVTWGWIPPKISTNIWLLLPEASDAYEAKYFTNYIEAMHFAGINAKQAASADEIPAHSTVLMPWATAPFHDDRRIGSLARDRHWTIIIAGEHTNSGDVASRIEKMTGQALLRRDLTTPRGNLDDSGPMRFASVAAWPPEAILNRGASISIKSLADKVLLTGDGWWSEPDLGEWLWVGDYVWQPSDRAGRLTMMAAFDVGGARWIVVGDNSPMINYQLVADPRPVIKILQAATLWPSFLADILLLVIAAVLILGSAPVVSIMLPTLAAVINLLVYQPSQSWRDYYLDQNGFDERNFNNVIVDNPDLVSKRRLIRLKSPVSGKTELPSGPATIFMRVKKNAEIENVLFDRCRRLGALNTDEGPYLMDAQACRITGQSEVLIGSENAAAAVAIGEKIIILDTAFLGQRAPLQNAEWLLKEIGR